MRATLAFLEKLTLEPETIDPGDVKDVLAAGVSDEALRDAIYVAGIFNAIDRVADALDFNVPPMEAFAASTKALLKRGYR